jgi:hypothetical protein
MLQGIKIGLEETNKPEAHMCQEDVWFPERSYMRRCSELLSSIEQFSWCSWLSHQSNTLKVSGSNPGENMRGDSSVGRASDWRSEGRVFDPRSPHCQPPVWKNFCLATLHLKHVTVGLNAGNMLSFNNVPHCIYFFLKSHPSIVAD